jgi:hypothetical protein
VGLAVTSTLPLQPGQQLQVQLVMPELLLLQVDVVLLEVLHSDLVVEAEDLPQVQQQTVTQGHSRLELPGEQEARPQRGDSQEEQEDLV